MPLYEGKLETRCPVVNHIFAEKPGFSAVFAATAN
jgi:hypothetical protein